MDLRGITEFFRDTFKYIVVAILVFLLFIFVIGLHQVVGPSMSPTYKEGSVGVINKLAYKFGEIKRGDIVILSESEKYMIKRVIGLPGEVIEYKNNRLYINGVEYKEDYLNDDVITEDFTSKLIPEGEYLVLGDNRSDSNDSRDYGFVPKKQIIGKVWFKIWPLGK